MREKKRGRKEERVRVMGEREEEREKEERVRVMGEREEEREKRGEGESEEGDKDTEREEGN